MKSLTRATVLLILTLSFYGCSYSLESGNNATLSEEQILNGSSSFSYAQINDLVLGPKCLGCHSGKEEPSLVTYQEVLANKDEIYEQTIATDKMPKGKPLGAAQLKALKLWLDAGAPEGVAQEQPKPNPADDLNRPVRWEQVRTKVIEKNCTSCHYEGNTDGISGYEDYDTVKATIGTIFYTISIQPVMPPAPKDWPEDQPNPNQLTREQKDLISAWITDGMLR